MFRKISAATPFLSMDQQRTNNMWRFVLVMLCSVAVSVVERNAAAQDWPWFLGPDHTGVVPAQPLLKTWPDDGPPILWSVEAGTGYSAPSVAGKRLVEHSRIDDREVIVCRSLDDGKSLWEYSYPSNYSDPYGYNNGPRCSPVLVDGKCYTLGAQGMLTCVSLDAGKLIWQTDLQEKFDLPEWFFGVGCSPIYEDGRLFVLVGGQPNSGVVAFRATDGDVLWSAVGRETWDGARTEDDDSYSWTGAEMVVSYSSPVLATIHGKRRLLCLMRQGLVSLDPATGREDYHYWFRASVHESVNAAQPVVIGNRIFLSAAYRTGSALLEVAPSGDSVHVVRRNKRGLQAHWSTPILYSGHLYGFTGRHENESELWCVRLSDGKVLWKTTGFDGSLNSLTRDRSTGQIINKASGEPVPYPFFGRGSLIRTGDRMILLGERGTLALAEMSPDGYSELGRCSVPGISYPAWTAPVIAHGRLLLRSENRLVCLDLRPTEDTD